MNSNKPFMKISCSKNRVEKIRQLIHIVCILDFQDVTGRELDLLCEILYNGGVNDKAKKSFMLTHKTSAANYGQIVKRLSDKAILLDKKNRSGKLLHKTFEDLKKLYVDDITPNLLAVIVN